MTSPAAGHDRADRHVLVPRARSASLSARRMKYSSRAKKWPVTCVNVRGGCRQSSSLATTFPRLERFVNRGPFCGPRRALQMTFRSRRIAPCLTAALACAALGVWAPSAGAAHRSGTADRRSATGPARSVAKFVEGTGRTARASAARAGGVHRRKPSPATPALRTRRGQTVPRRPCAARARRRRVRGAQLHRTRERVHPQRSGPRERAGRVAAGAVELPRRVGCQRARRMGERGGRRQDRRRRVATAVLDTGVATPTEGGSAALRTCPSRASSRVTTSSTAKTISRS